MAPGITRRRFVTCSIVAAPGGVLSAGTIGAPQTTSPASIGDAGLLEDLVAANRILAQHDIVDAWGHVSVRNHRAVDRYFLSRSLAPDLVTRVDLIEFDSESKPVRADARPLYLERFIHGEIYRARSDVNAVVHCHTPSLIPFGVTAVRLRPLYHLAAFIGEGLPVFDIRDTAGASDMLVSDRERGRALARALGERPAVLMRGHGAVVVGSSLPVAVGRCIYLDVNARLQTAASSLGGDIRYLDSAEAGQVMASGENGGYARGWELWKQQVTSKRC